ncbi:MAG: Nif11-like leader peptide family RiPP precursor [Nitrospirae bacterium YQR-1]
MSVESAIKYIEKLSSDMEFRNKVEAVKDKEVRNKIIKEAGFDFTEAELKQITLKSTELSEKHLEKIAGGNQFDDGYGNSFPTATLRKSF